MNHPGIIDNLSSQGKCHAADIFTRVNKYFQPGSVLKPALELVAGNDELVSLPFIARFHFVNFFKEIDKVKTCNKWQRNQFVVAGYQFQSRFQNGSGLKIFVYPGENVGRMALSLRTEVVDDSRMVQAFFLRNGINFNQSSP